MSKLTNTFGKLMNKLMLSCDEATLLITKSEYQQLCSIKQLKLRMHLATCSFCRTFQKQNLIISQNIDQLKKVPEDLKMVLDDDKKQELQSLIEKKNK